MYIGGFVCLEMGAGNERQDLGRYEQALEKIINGK
jgi:hypothetical protein